MAKILVVDDSLFQRKNIVKLLKKAGHEVVQAADGQLGLDSVETEKPELILSDLLMPNMDGFQMIEALKDKGSTIPIIVLSADIQTTSNERVQDMGVFAKLDKPPSQEELLATVEKALS